MTTTTRYFKSTDTSAPVVTGQSGSILSAIRACLVGTSGVAYGSGGTAKTAAGWSEAFTGTATKGVFQNKVSAGGLGKYVRILDDGSLSSGFKDAQMLCYDTMSNIDTGTNIMPTVAQAATGIFLHKSITADSTARPWWLAADEKGFYMFVQAGTPATSGTDNNLFGAGDIDSEIPSDAYGFIATGRTSTGPQSGFSNTNSYTSTGTAGLWIMRGYAQTGNPILPSPMSLGANGFFGSSSGGMADPSVGTNNRYVVPVYLSGENNIRGRLRGVLNCLNNLTSTVNTPTEISSTPGRPTGSILLTCPHSTTGGLDIPMIECGATWDTP